MIISLWGAFCQGAFVRVAFVWGGFCPVPIIIYGVTIIFLKFPTAIFLVTRPYMVSRTHTYNKIVQINLAAE
jgi:hypothetical protein